jgi:hypothetical protein
MHISISHDSNLCKGKVKDEGHWSHYGVAQWPPRFSTVKISDFKLSFTLSEIGIF